MPFIADSIAIAPPPADDGEEWVICEDEYGDPWECEFCHNTGWLIFRNHITKAERAEVCSECGNPHDLPKP